MMTLPEGWACLNGVAANRQSYWSTDSSLGRPSNVISTGFPMKSGPVRLCSGQAAWRNLLFDQISPFCLWLEVEMTDYLAFAMLTSVEITSNGAGFTDSS
ncbi:MAG: hypothetical protein ACYTE3_15560 [Planctomycetota bacterium]|jgi:hypothetical protein